MGEMDTMDYSLTTLHTATTMSIITFNKFMNIMMLFMYRMISVISPSLLFGQIIVQNSLNPDINWVGLYFMSTKQLWM